MKIDIDIRNKVIKEIRSHVKSYYRKTKVDTTLMEDVDTVERFMELKQDLLRHIVQMMPFLTTHCYFCMLHELRNYELDCVSCEYGKFHGICRGDITGSTDFSVVDHARGELWRAIDYKYYSNEDYDAAPDREWSNMEHESVAILKISEDTVRPILRDHGMSEETIRDLIAHNITDTFALHMNDYFSRYWDDAVEYAYKNACGDDDAE